MKPNAKLTGPRPVGNTEMILEFRGQVERLVMPEFISVFDRKPVDVGWYAILICWESNEGFLPCAAYWNGEKFTTDLPVSNFVDIVFPTEELAEKYAEENDPNW